jgi:beta-lactamase regulating signal transducer with metallopeptidase domain
MHTFEITAIIAVLWLAALFLGSAVLMVVI